MLVKLCTWFLRKKGLIPVNRAVAKLAADVLNADSGEFFKQKGKVVVVSRGKGRKIIGRTEFYANK